MATIYFTSNADSGDGTLRAAMLAANDGDEIRPDPAAFANVDEIVISLSSGLPLASVSIIGTPEKRIVLDRQRGGYFFRVTSSGKTLSFSFVDFANGNRTSSNESPFYIASTNTSLTFESCKFYGNTGAYSGFLRGISSATGASILFRNCLAYNNDHTNSTYSAAVFTYQTAADPSIVLEGCTFDTDGEIPFTNPGAYTRTDCLFNGANDWQVDFSAVGFVDRTANDYRLAPGSAYLSGGTLSGVDILGHARTGSFGAFDGSWLVAPATVSASSSVDYLEIGSSGTLTLSGADVVLTVSRGTYFSAGGSAVSASRGYIVLPAGETSSGLTLSNVVCAYSGAGASNFAATTSGMTWSAVDSAVSVVLELEVSGAWTTIVQTTGTSYSTPLSAGSNVRLFDGVQFLTATVPAEPEPPGEFDFHPWGTYGATITVATSSAFSAITQTAAPFAYLTEYILMSDFYNAGETPVLFARITNSQTGAPIPAADVSAISYTCNRLNVGWGTETRTPVEGHEDVDVDASAVLAALVTNDPRWTIDTTGYNFKLEPDSRTNPIFPSSGNYEIVVTIEFSNANPLPLVFNVTVN